MVLAIKMGFASDQLREKALLALEEALQEVRYPPARRPLSLRFSLAYLWTIRGKERRVFDEFWTSFANTSPSRFGIAERALAAIYIALGLVRDDAPSWHFWRKRQQEARLAGEHRHQSCYAVTDQQEDADELPEVSGQRHG